MSAIPALYKSLTEAEDRYRQYRSLVAKLRDALGFKTGHKPSIVGGRVVACACGYSPGGYPSDQAILVEMHIQESWKRRAENDE